MVNSRSPSSCARPAARTERPRSLLTSPLIALLLCAAGCGHADAPASDSAAAAPAGTTAPTAERIAGTLCTPADRGYLKARLQGSIEAEVDWAAGVPQCRGGVRPGGDGVRLLYKGSDAARQPLLLVFGVGPLRAGESARNVPVNVTVVREGSGEFFATQGDDKCALDSVRQEPMPSGSGQYLLTGRGYCTQPARAVGKDGAVLVSRFDLQAIVDYRQ